jgi:hypothetical protein
LIRDGGKTASKKPKSTKKTEKEAMKNYMKMLYNKPRLTVPLDDPYPTDTLRETLEGKEVEEGEGAETFLITINNMK